MEADDHKPDRNGMRLSAIPMGRPHRGHAREFRPVGPDYARHHCVSDSDVACVIGTAANLGCSQPRAPTSDARLNRRQAVAKVRATSRHARHQLVETLSEVSRNAVVPLATTDLHLPLECLHRRVQQERVMGARHSHLGLDPHPPRAARDRLRLAHFDCRAERIVIIDVGIEAAFRAQFEPQPVDPHHPSRLPWSVRVERSPGPGSGGSSASAAAGARTGSSSASAEHRHRRLLRARPDHRPVGGGDRQPDPVTGRKHRARVVELDAHPIALPWHQRRRRLVSVAMREVQYSEAHPQRRAIRMHIAKPDHQIRKRPVGRDIERDDRRAEDLRCASSSGAVSNTSERASSSC